MKKLLIHFHENMLAPTGGPAGYLYNLVSGIHSDSIRVDLLPPSGGQSKGHKLAKKHMPVRLQEFARAMRMSKMTEQCYQSAQVDFHEYDAIHFHSTQSLYFSRELLKDYKGKVILTSHTPSAPYKEEWARLNPKDFRLFGRKLKKMEQIDRMAFERADHIIFPCEEAEEPYYNTWPEYEKIRQKEKYLYLPTGINPCSAKKTREEIRKQYAIPEDAFMVCYVGRHNEIKGYDALKRIGAEMTKENVWFLIAGSEGPLMRLENDQWIEAGWTKDPHSLICAADMFILPNKETYFDLVLLEVLSLGKIVVASDCGGNKYFRRFDPRGILYYRSEQEAMEQIRKVKAMSDSERKAMEEANLHIYEQNFTTEIFAERYLELIEQII